MSNNAKIVRDYYKKNLTLFTDRIFEGELKAFVSLLRQGIISEEVVLKNLNISEEELEKRIKVFAI